MMANGDAFEHAVGLAKEHPNQAVSCHLAVVGGKSVSPEDSPLSDENGLLPKILSQLIFRIVTGKIHLEHIEREFAAQVERLIATGIQPAHLDTHKHTATHPTVTKALAHTAKDFAIPSVRLLLKA
jgi:chitin disaccharide deacetylase